jgi:hypothetical protein
MIKYRYALDKDGNIIDIIDLERIELKKEDKFLGLDFGQELIPRLGKIKRKHFAQKQNSEIIGNGETYLHALGKKVFYDDYVECLKNNIPYYLDYKTEIYCDRLKHEYNIKCLQKTEKKKFDLTKYFNEVKVEKKDGRFIPDIMLLNSQSGEKIYIEIAVTHDSTEQKRQSGYRIIEFKILKEDDIQKITDFRNGNSDNFAKLYNFKKNIKYDACCEVANCKKYRFNWFSVSKNGKCNLNVLKESEINSKKEKYLNSSIWNTVEPIEYDDENEHYSREDLIFIGYVVRAHKEGANVKNCFLCRYHAKNQSWDFDFEPKKPIFCKYLKTACGSNQAAVCRYYKIDLNALKHHYNL